MTTNTMNPRRRALLKAAGLASAGLTLGFTLDVARAAQGTASAAAGKANPSGASHCGAPAITRRSRSVPSGPPSKAAIGS